jgi:hypothetical protein
MDLQEIVQTKFQQSLSWTQTLTFTVRLPDQDQTQSINVMQYCQKDGENSRTRQVMKVFFNVLNNNAAPPFDPSNATWEKLFQDLYMACKGTAIVRNGTWGSTIVDGDSCPQRRIQCYRCFEYQGNQFSFTLFDFRSNFNIFLPLRIIILGDLPETDEVLSEYRVATVSRDWRNSRTDGIHGKRKCTTHRTLDGNTKCGFAFVIGYDDLNG